MTDAMRPDSVEEPSDDSSDGPMITEPTKIIRIASMTRALLEEARSASLDDAGRHTLMEIHDRSLSELRGVFSDDLLEEFDAIFEPVRSVEGPSESIVRIAQAQLIGWLEGLFHGIQASIASQQMAAQAQLQQMQQRRLRAPAPEGEDPNTGLYL